MCGLPIRITMKLKEEIYEMRCGVEGFCHIIVLREDGGWGFVALKYFHSYTKYDIY